MQKPFDLVLFGATGFTGRLVAEVLLRESSSGGALRWAMAGRDTGKLAQVRQSIGAPDSLHLLQADAADANAMARLATQARVVISTVGPYQLYGQPLVQACAEAGTDYVDLCGEPNWMAQMIPLLQAPAAASGARIVFSCGFDSIPFDLGVLFLQQQAIELLGQPLQRVHGLVQKMKGTLSGGTLASALATWDAARQDPALARLMADPFALTPGFAGPPQAADEGARFDDLAQAWTAPFLMAPINTKNVHRSNALRDHPWGRDFVYDERLLAKDRISAQLLAQASRLQEWVLDFSPARRLVQSLVLPKPGQGPSRRAREAGHYALLMLGQSRDGRTLSATVTGQGDPGYASTSKMVSQAALCLLRDVNQSMTPGGVWTPGAALGLALLRRLQTHADLRFELRP